MTEQVNNTSNENTADTSPSESEQQNWEVQAQVEEITTEPALPRVPFYPSLDSKFQLRANLVTAVPSGEMVQGQTGWFVNQLVVDSDGSRVSNGTAFIPTGVFENQYQEQSIGCYGSRTFRIEVTKEPKVMDGRDIAANTLILYNEKLEPLLMHQVQDVVTSEKFFSEFIDIGLEEARLIDDPVVWSNNNGLTASVTVPGVVYQFFAAGEESDYAEQLSFQNKPVPVVGINGTNNEAVIAVLLDRLNFLNIQLPCEENKTAIDGLNIAMGALEARHKRMFG
jgi:hypothetical protein